MNNKLINKIIGDKYFFFKTIYNSFGFYDYI